MATITGSAGTHINAAATVGNDGALADEADQAVTAQSFADDLATIHATINPANTIIRTFRGGPFDLRGGPWDFDATIAGVWTDGGITGSIASSPLDVPHGAIVTAINATIKPTGGGRGALPTMPHLNVVAIPLSTGTAASQQQADTTGTVLAYEALHQFPSALVPTGSNTAWSAAAVNTGDFRTNGGKLYQCINGGSSTSGPSGTGQTVEAGGVVWVWASNDPSAYVVDRRTNRYHVKFVGENGGGPNAVAGLQLIALKATYTIVRLGMES